MSSIPARSVSVAQRRRDASPRLRLFTSLDEHHVGATRGFPDTEPGLESLEGRLKRIPVGMGALLILLGVADLAIPFTPMIGPALVGFGCVNLCAHTNSLGSLDRWLARRAPRARGHVVACTTEMLHLGEEFGARFRADLAARYAD